MKKLNIIFYVIGTFCILMAMYIIYDKYFAKDVIEINFNEDEEIVLINNKLSEVGTSLGWIVIVDGINNQDRNGNYVLSYNKNLLENYGYKQLFVMEHILSNPSNYDKFIVYSSNDSELYEASPTDEFTEAYLIYKEYNVYYKSLFGEEFDNNKAKKGNISFDQDYVYYENRRFGNNGIYVSMILATNVEYDDDIYTASVTLTYSTRASELVGATEDKAIIEYTKDINRNIILKSFSLKDR